MGIHTEFKLILQCPRQLQEGVGGQIQEGGRDKRQGHLSFTTSLLSLQGLQAEAGPLPPEGTILTHPAPLPFPHPIQSTDYFSPAHSSPHVPATTRVHFENFILWSLG